MKLPHEETGVLLLTSPNPRTGQLLVGDDVIMHVNLTEVRQKKSLTSRLSTL
ncbi:hypothetical protein BH20ACI2_BH20ACI2_10370 [soil metagenome]